MSTAAAALLTFLFRILGTTNDVTTCEHCGRTELKGTIILGVLDEDGNVVDRVHYGATCGARAAGQTVKEFRKAATDADRPRLAAAAAARYAARHAADEAFAVWAYENYGPAPARYMTKSIHEMRAEFGAVCNPEGN